MYQWNRSFNIPPPPPGIPQAFDTFVVPGRREFDYQSLQGVGNLNQFHVKSLSALHVTSYHGRDAVCDKRRLPTYRLAGKWGKHCCEML